MAARVYFLFLEHSQKRGRDAGTEDARSAPLIRQISDQLQPQPVCGAKTARTHPVKTTARCSHVSPGTLLNAVDVAAGAAGMGMVVLCR